MATVYKIHPAIGIARVGNSPDEFFIGPERIGERPNPAGGFKDAQCRVKRQAVRFRIYAHHDDGSVEEITDTEADIKWTVHLVNKKAANPGRGNTESASDLTIDPGARTLGGPNQIKTFDSGKIKFSDASVVTVPLGEIRSDDKNHLLILGGFGKSASPQGTGIDNFWASDDWYDDVSDGPVTAAIKIRSTSATPSVVGAWVIVAPPKFAPHIDNVITLYDRIFQAMVDANLMPVPLTTSYTNDVYPILQRARDTKWVQSVLSIAHIWVDPITDQLQRNAIFGHLTAPGGQVIDMPDLNENTPDGRLTNTQYAHMQRWKDNNPAYTDDWTGVPAPQASITPDGLDRAALENCVGGAFYPGIEAGGRNAAERPIITTSNYLEAFRLNHAVVNPGDMTYTMALPWQADFNACGDNWWPVPRPNDVTPQGQSSSVRWSRDVGDMVTKWHTLGFVVKQGNQHVEVDRCTEPSITLLTPHLNFQDVPQGPIGMVREKPLAISFEIISPAASVTLDYAPGGAPVHPQLVPFNNSVTVGPTAANNVATARLWIIFRAVALGNIPLQMVTVQHAASNQQWTITITGNTVERKTVATALVLDRSGSMSEDRGDGQSKHSSLQRAASIFVDVMLEGDGVGLIRYNEDAQVLQQVLQLGNGGLSDINRGVTNNLINGNSLDPQGATSIGDGIFEGRGILSAYDVKALVVLTDGKENRSRYIADVAAEINEQTYAIGLGTPQNTSAASLQTISGNNGGFLLITGAIGQDNGFLLQKYFLQILAGISNAEVVLDPDGELVVGRVHRIPFQLTDADAGVDVILLTPNTNIVDFRLQTPNGLIIEPWRAMSEPGMRYVLSNGVSYYRLVLPTQLVAGRFDQGGTWHALLTIGRPHFERTPGSEYGVDRSILHGMHAAGTTEHMSKRRRTEAERSLQIATHGSVHTSGIRSSFAVAATNYAVATHVPDRQKETVPYSLVVHSYSSVSLRAGAGQTGYKPGASVRLHATLTESAIPLQQGGIVWAEIKRPDGTSVTIDLKKQEDGLFVASFVTTVAGVYHFRVRARGQTRKGLSFSRERSLTAAVWHGGDRDAETASGGSDCFVNVMRERDEKLCELLKCLTAKGSTIDIELEKHLQAKGLDLDHLRKCLHQFCRGRGKDTQENNVDS
ncbi:MAG: VWA domain-containing protein [Candidatus Brocadia sp.]|nr:VWA domain-containing protein [Candidatus Brocadia sp.]